MPREITRTRTVYKYDELSEKAKTHAWTENMESDEYPWSHENRKSLEMFCEHFSISVTDWEYGGYSLPHISWTLKDSWYYDYTDKILDFEGVRLHKWIVNNCWDWLFKPKTISTTGRYVDGRYTYKSYKSKCQVDNSCVLTGYCVDDDLLQPLYCFLKNPQEGIALERLIGNCLDSWLQYCHKDRESYFSQEYFAEQAIEQGYEFYENGERSHTEEED